MQYFSTHRQSPLVDFRTAAITGQAPDKGLYFPQQIPSIQHWLSKPLADYQKVELAYQVMKPYIGQTIDEASLLTIVADTIDFDFPLVAISDQIATLELFHGPTLAFKDVGARFMSRCLGYFNKNNHRLVTVLVATSGDTGGAVANGFDGVEGVEVIILYPQGRVSPVQELQLTTCGNNIHALEITGSFDDCQAMVKQAFLDADLNTKYQLTSANSINVARWLPQQLYYFFAAQQWQQSVPPVLCVPSGNFGNICAGMLAFKSGLPVSHFIAACNANDTIPHYLQTGVMAQKPSVATISNAMDVAVPSNFERILEIFSQDMEELKRWLTAVSISDLQTRNTLQKVFTQYGYLLDPHGAVGFAALETFLENKVFEKGIFLETAHPVKFPEVVEEMTGQAPIIPDSIQPLFDLPQKKNTLGVTYQSFKEFMMAR